MTPGRYFSGPDARREAGATPRDLWQVIVYGTCRATGRPAKRTLRVHAEGPQAAEARALEMAEPILAEPRAISRFQSLIQTTEPETIE